jgi:hypothetical protein
MQIIVKTSIETYLVEVEPNYTIETLKTIIQDTYGLPFRQQTIQLNGITLNDDNKTLNDYHISHDSIVHLVLRIRE